jgi:shikimate kinase
MQLFLTGFMGSGKSSLGQALASNLGIPFIDLDTRIEQYAEQTIPEIFATEGEGYFRILESKILRQIDTTSSAVIATGGGTPCYHENMDWMLECGIVFYLECTPELLYQRILQSPVENRPVLQQKSEQELKYFIENKLLEREGFYKNAHFIIDGAASQDSLVKDVAAYAARFKLGF